MKKLTITEMNRLTPEAFHAAPKVPLVAVLDNVRSQHNVGAVFRTADAFRLQGVWLCGICCCPPNDEIHKTALGAENTVDWRYFKDTLDAVKALHEAGFKVFAVEQAHGSVTLESLTAKRPNSEAVHQRSGLSSNNIAVVFGHEVFGVQQAVVDACDGCIEIPQYGTKHSLNVSVTAGIVLYELSNALIARS
jgi:tRNA G18 (ribose-2'-O)-methylase SpoU